MYIIKSYLEKDVIHKGDWPYQYILKELMKGKKLIVISTYSNTIKVPTLEYDHGKPIVETWEVNI